jgi:hypothetical protein
MKICCSSGDTNGQNGEASRDKMYYVIACYVMNILFYSKED